MLTAAGGKKGSKKKMLKRKRLQSSSQSDGEPQQPVAKVGKKRGRKRKGTQEEGNPTKTSNTTPLTETAAALATSHVKNSNSTATLPSESVSTSEPALKVAEISPFERVPTYKCQYCPKRTQSLERIERHLAAEHSKDKAGSEGEESGYRVLTRDQVVDILTLQRQKRQSSSSSLATKLATLGGAFQTDYVCFYCDDVGGSIYEVKSHFKEEHDPTNDKFKVKRSQAGKKVTLSFLLEFFLKF